MADAKQVIRDFCAAWESLDAERIAGFFTDDGVYFNIPMQPAKGKDAIKALLGMILGPAKSVKFEIKHMVAEGDVVLNERLDTFEMKDGKTVALRVMGAYELRDGKIAEWRDYFDLAEWTRQAT
jgi:limonene-1,2-epoxide hydrolase